MTVVARKKTSTAKLNVKTSISNRLREIRLEVFGEHGGPEIARLLDLPARTWYNYETGVTVPAEVLLGFIDETNVNPLWIFHGEGPKYRGDMETEVLSDLSPEQLIRRGLEKLEEAPDEVTIVAPEGLPEGTMSDFAAVGLVPPAALAKKPFANLATLGHVLAYRKWVPHPRETQAVRLEDDAMAPILPSGSVVAIDRTVRDAEALQGKIVAAIVEGVPVVRWLDLAGRHLLLRAQNPGRDYPTIPVIVEEDGPPVLVGKVIWSWSRFDAE